MASCTHGRPRLRVGGRAGRPGPAAQGPRRPYRRWLHDLEVRNGSSPSASTRSRPRRRGSRRRSPSPPGASPRWRASRSTTSSDGSPVGTSGLTRIDWRYSRATFGIAIGARPRARAGHRGHPPDARLGLQHPRPAERDAHRLPSNAGAIRVYEKAGFKRIGARRNALVLWARAATRCSWTSSASEFDSPVLAARR